jgi:hypothetical protein
MFVVLLQSDHFQELKTTLRGSLGLQLLVEWSAQIGMMQRVVSPNRNDGRVVSPNRNDANAHLVLSDPDSYWFSKLWRRSMPSPKLPGTDVAFHVPVWHVPVRVRLPLV